MLKALDRKLLRDLWAAKGQALAIALVIAAGVAMFTAYRGTFQSLQGTLDAYYDDNRFADVFANAKRAPLRLTRQVEALPGVAAVEARVVVDVTLDVAGLEEPATGRLISIPEQRRTMVNDLFLRSGRYLEPNRPDEVLANEAFANAHDLEPGDTVTAIINGRRRDLKIVGLALSPEYIYTIRPGEIIPDDRRFGIFWMERRALAAAFDMEGGFNDLAIQILPGASEAAVIAGVDRLLKPYGGLGAIPRKLQLSNFSVSNELMGLKTAGAVVPAIFLTVAAFLLNIVLSRMISVEREQIAALKALGYSNRALGFHYLKWALLVGGMGGVLGMLGGSAMGYGMTQMYNQYFRFPRLEYGVPEAVLLFAFLISLVAAVVGVMGAVRSAVMLPPAEGMRPEPPARYRVSWVERLGLKRWLSQVPRMVLRNIGRRPGRSTMAILGVACAEAMLITGTFALDSMDRMLEVQFERVQREDVLVTFVEPVSNASRYAVARLPGVLYHEPVRFVPARLRFGPHSRQLAITGTLPDAQLSRIVDASLREVTPAPEGLVLSSMLAQELGVKVGDQVTVEVLEGARPVRSVVVSHLVDDFMGISAYMDQRALHRMLRESRVLSGATLVVDPRQEGELYRHLKTLPAVAGVTVKRAAVENFQRTLAENMGIMITFNVLFALIIAVGVVYNGARISLSERARELASLRVMGFTRGEISSILLGELGLTTLAAMPVGLVLGYGLAGLTAKAFSNELYRFPLVLSAQTALFAVLIIGVATVASGLLVRRRLDHLDLVAVLKTRE
jgi:putative ABC transport system permease protein